jgi:hypothetical protein
MHTGITLHSIGQEASMSRQLRVLLALVLVSFAFSATACAGAASRSLGPSFAECDTNNSNTCH